MVHQHFKLVEVFSVLDNIILGAEPPDHYALVSYLLDLLVSQSSALMPLHSETGYQSV